MASEWRKTTIGAAFSVNPPRPLKRGSVAPFIPMDALPQHARAVGRIEMREYTGSGMRFCNGDTLIARITPCLENGKTAYVSGLRDGEVGHGSTEYIVLSGRPGESDSLFGYYLARSPDFRRYAIGHMEGTSGRQRVPSSAIERFPITLPPISEQRAIAHILGTLDDKIELNRKQNETLEAMARALFKAWFVDFEPVRAKMEGRWQRGQSLPGLPAHLYDLFPDRLVDSELGDIPEGWRVFAFGDVAQQGKGVVNPGNSPQDLFTHYSLPAFDSAHCPSIEPGHAIKSNKTPVPDGAVLVSKLNPHIPRVWHVGTAGPNAVCSTEFIVWAPKAPANSAFLYCLASSPEFSGAMHQLVTGTSNSHQRVKPDQLREIRVFAATENAIEAFSEWVRSPLEKILQNRQQSRTLTVLRDTLLPKLISGELRVKDAETFLERVAA